jgi:hypothetical protein
MQGKEQAVATQGKKQAIAMQGKKQVATMQGKQQQPKASSSNIKQATNNSKQQ